MFSIYFPSIDRVRQFSWKKTIKHFTGAKLHIFLGGDHYTNSFMKGFMSKMTLTIFCQSAPFINLPCHQACFTCDGPTQNNCLSCSETQFRSLSKFDNSCICQEGYYENGVGVCETAVSSLPYIQIQQVEIKCQLLGYNICDDDQIECSFGYFQFKKKCIQCPNYYEINSLIHFTCFNCIISPLEFANNLTCIQEASTFQFNQQYLYEIRVKNKAEISYYEISVGLDQQFELILCTNCVGKQVCKPGYFYSNSQCISCIEGCQTCLDINNCDQCYQNYYKDIDNKCKSCQSCASCTSFGDDIYCVTCEEKQILVIATCLQCGRKCDQCDEHQYCNFCQGSPQDYYISLDGKNCNVCNIKNCIYCFEYIFSENMCITSFDINFSAFNSNFHQINIGCALCSKGYFYNWKSQECELQTINNDCEFAIINSSDIRQKCIRGSEQDAIQTTNCLGIQFCLECINNYIANNSFCIVCQDGYYSQILTGQCSLCPNYCKSCVQQNQKYQDYWKWEIKAFYQFFINLNNDHSFEKFASISSEKEMEVICTSCHIGYIQDQFRCIQDCDKSCLKCEIIKGKSTCIQCRETSQSLLKSLSEDGNCLLCPSNCAACLNRNESEIAKINPYFILTSQNVQQTRICFEKTQKRIQNIYYHYDTFTQTLSTCNEKEKCFNRVIFKLNIFCDYSDYYEQMSQENDNQFFVKSNIPLDRFYDEYYIDFFESQQLYAYLTEISVKQVSYQFTLIQGNAEECLMKNNMNIYSTLLQNIFTLQQIDIEFMGKEYQTKLKIQSQINLSNFTSVSFTNIQFNFGENIFNSLDSTIINLYNLKHTLTLKLINCIFITANGFARNYTLQFNSNIPYALIINNLILENFRIFSSNLFQFEDQEYFQKNHLNLKQLTIRNSFFFNSTLFKFIALNNNLNFDSNFSDVEIKETTFMQSQFILSKSLLNYTTGTVVFDNLRLKNMEMFFNSNFAQLPCVTFAKFEAVQLENSRFCNNSRFYSSNKINIENCIVDNTQIFDSNLIINDVDYSRSEQALIESSKIFIKSCNIINNEYNNHQQLILIKKYQEISDVYLQIEDIFLSNNRLTTKIEQNQIYYHQSIIYLECQICLLKNIIISRGYGFPEISIPNSKILNIKNFTVSQDQRYMSKVLHTSMECVNKFTQMDQYFILYIGQYKSVNVESFSIINCLSFNNAYIIFQGYDIMEASINESIIIQNSQFWDNKLIITDSNKNAALISITSSQSCVINISNSNFSNNHLNEYFQDSTSPSATVLYMSLQQGLAFIKNCTFLKNLVTNSSDSIIYIKSTSLHLQNLYFTSSNIKFISKMSQSVIFSTIQNLSQIDFEAAFPIKSKGGNGYFIVKELIINNISINSSNSLQGGGFYIATQGMSKILISNSFFINTQTQLQSSVFSSGGCLYIDASLSQLTFSLINSSIDTSFAKQEGGGAVIIPSEIYNRIEVINLTIKDCFSLKYSFLAYSPNKVENLISNLIFQNVNFYQTQDGLNRYLSLLEQLTNSQAQQFANYNPLIFARFSNFTLTNCNFHSTYIQFLLQLDQVDNIILTDIKVINCSTFSSPLFKMKSQIRIYNLEFVNVESKLIAYDATCMLVDQELKNEILCPEETQKGSLTIDEPDFTQKNQLQLICNQILIFSNNEYKFSLFEIDQINSNQYLFVQHVKFSNTQCEICQFGLMRILGFEQIEEQNMKFSYIEIKNCKCGISGCLSIIRSDDVSSQSSLSDNLRFLKQLDYDFLESKMNQQLSILKSIFVNNSAQLGGSLYLFDIETLIRQCIFVNNSARIGGAIYYNSSQKQLLIIETDITMNFAEIAGGLFINSLYLQSTKELDVIIVDNNSTLYGDNVVEKPSSLTLSLNGGYTFLETKILISSENEIVEQIIIHPYKTYGLSTSQVYLMLPSGQAILDYQYFDNFTLKTIPYNYQLRVIALDKFKKQIKGLDNSYCTLSPLVYNMSTKGEEINVTFSLSFYNVSFNQSTGDYNLDNLVIYFNPNYSQDLVLRLFIKCHAVSVPQYKEKPPYQIDKSLKSYKIFVDIQTFPCQIGEFLNYTSGGCVICDPYKNQYSVQLEAKSCSYKDDSKINSIKSSMIELRPSYWRTYYYSDIVEYCYHLPQNCIGGWLPGDYSCLLGHIGALCEQCDLYDIRGDGQFSVSQDFQCGNCDQISYNVLISILISLWTLLSVLLSVSSTVAVMKDFIREIRLRAFGISHSIKEASPAILIKIFTNYLQIIQAISTFKLEVPFNVLIILQSLANPIGSMAYSLDCFIVSFTNIEIIYFKLIWSLTMAALYLIFFFLLLGIAVSIKLIRLDVSYISTPFIYLFIYLQPNLIGQIISLLSYRKISNENWIQGNVSYRYDTISHQKWTYSLCLPLLIVFGCIIPLFFMFKLFNNKKQLNRITIRKIWGYLYNEYKRHAFYWETLKIIEKEAIIIVLIYYNDHIQIKASIVFLILFYYSFLTTSYKPYATGQLNRLDTQSTIICAISIIMASCIYTAQQQELNEIILPSYFVLGFINSLYIIQMIIQIVLSYFKRLDLLVDKLKEIILKNFPNFITQHPKIYNFLEGKKQKQLRVKIKYKKLKDYLLAKARRILQFKMFNENLLSNQISLKGFEQEQNQIISPQVKSIQSEVVLNTSQLISERINQNPKCIENQQKSIFYAFKRENNQRLLKEENILPPKPEKATL